MSHPGSLRSSAGFRTKALILAWGFCLIWLQGAARENLPGGDCSRVELWKEEAERLVQEGRLAEAAEAYRGLLACTPDWAEGWWRLGTLEYDRGSFAAARDAFSRLIEHRPDHGLGYLFRGLASLKLQHWPEALDDLRRSRDRGLGPDRRFHILAAHSEAAALCRLGRYDEAFPLLRQLVNADPENPRIHELLGVAVLRLEYPAEGLSDSAREAARRAGLAFSYAETRQIAEGRREFEKLLEERPDLPHGRYAYGVLLLADDPDAAVREFERELQRDPRHLAALLQLASEMLQREERDQARHYIERALTVEPRSPAALGLKGRLLMEEGDAESAVRWVEEAVRLAPDNQKLHIQLARIYFRLGRREEALREQAIVERLGGRQQGSGSPETEAEDNPPR